MRWTVYNHVLAVPSLNVQAIASDTDTNGDDVDLDQTGQDFRVATLVAVSGTLTDGTYAFKVQESADGSTGWADVPDARIQGTNPSFADTEDNTVKEVGIIPDPGSARFLRAVCTTTDVVTGGTVGAFFLLGGGNVAPVTRA